MNTGYVREGDTIYWQGETGDRFAIGEIEEPVITNTATDLDSLAKEVHDTSRSKGFWQTGRNDDVYAAKLALIHSEVTEWLEAIRKEKGEEEELLELADVIIRLLDLYQARKEAGLITLSVDEMLQYKADQNKERPHKHGNRF